MSNISSLHKNAFMWNNHISPHRPIFCALSTFPYHRIFQILFLSHLLSQLPINDDIHFLCLAVIEHADCHFLIDRIYGFEEHLIKKKNHTLLKATRFVCALFGAEILNVAFLNRKGWKKSQMKQLERNFFALLGGYKTNHWQRIQGQAKQSIS